MRLSKKELHILRFGGAGTGNLMILATKIMMTGISMEIKVMTKIRVILLTYPALGMTFPQMPTITRRRRTRRRRRETSSHHRSSRDHEFGSRLQRHETI
jgi:hypothetical protein